MVAKKVEETKKPVPAPKAQPVKKPEPKPVVVEEEAPQEEEVAEPEVAPVEEVAEEPKAEEVAEEPKAEEVAEEPKAEEVAEEPKAEEEQKVEEAAPAEAENPNGEVELFIGNLPYTANEDQIAEFFGVYGEIANVKLLQREGRPAGKGFVQFNNPSDAAKAKQANGMDYQGRPIQVRFASDPIPQQQDRQGGSPRRAQNPNTIFVGGLSYNSTSDSVGQFFGQCGNVTNVRVATDPEGNPRGFAHVEFDTPEAVQAALGLTGQELDGRSIRVDTAGAKGEKPAGGRFGGQGGQGGQGGFGGRPPRRGGFGAPRRGGFGGRPQGPGAAIDHAPGRFLPSPAHPWHAHLAEQPLWPMARAACEQARYVRAWAHGAPGYRAGDARSWRCHRCVGSPSPGLPVAASCVTFIH